MSTTDTTDHFTTLPDERTLQATVVALEEHGFSVEVAGDLDAAREAVLARIPDGSSVMTNTSVTLAETGIADAINDGGPYDSARNKMFALDFATQAQQIRGSTVGRLIIEYGDYECPYSRQTAYRPGTGRSLPHRPTRVGR